MGREARLGFASSVGQQKCTSPGATQPLAPDEQSQDVTGLVSVGLSGLGDLLQQRIEAGRQRGPTSMAIYRSPPTINWSRTANMSTSFGLTAGLLCHHWYKLLDNFLPGRTLRTIVVKIAWDQV